MMNTEKQYILREFQKRFNYTPITFREYITKEGLSIYITNNRTELYVLSETDNQRQIEDAIVHYTVDVLATQTKVGEISASVKFLVSEVN